MDEAKPAAAYREIADLLPRSYFLKPPPIRGVRLIVAWADGIRTQWDMSALDSDRVIRFLRSRRLGTTVFTWSSYDDSRAAR